MAVALFLGSLHAEMIDLDSTTQSLPGAPSDWVTCLFTSCNTMSSRWCLGIPLPLAGGSLIVIPWRGTWCHGGTASGGGPRKLGVTCLPTVFPLGQTERGKPRKQEDPEASQRVSDGGRGWGWQIPAAVRLSEAPRVGPFILWTAAQLPAGVSDPAGVFPEPCWCSPLQRYVEFQPPSQPREPGTLFATLQRKRACSYTVWLDPGSEGQPP